MRDDGRSLRGEVGLETSSLIRTRIDNGGVGRSRIVQTRSDLIDGRLEVKLMVECRRWLSMGGSGWLSRSSNQRRD